MEEIDYESEFEEIIKLIEKCIKDILKENEPILVKKYVDYGAEYKCPRCGGKIIHYDGYYNIDKYCCNCGLRFIWNNGKKELIDELTNMIDSE